MPRPKNPTPAYKLHKPTNTARCWVNGAWVSLGKYNSPESRQAHARLCLELAVCPAVVPTSPTSGFDLTINEILLAFWRHAEQHYRHPDGSPTSEVNELRLSLRPVRELYGYTLAREFGPLALKAVRQRMLENDLCRSLINHRIDKVKRVFKWATAEELVPVTVYQSLRTLAGLRKGRTEARESKPVLPVDPAHVAATLPFLNRHQQAMVELQQLTGMRPGEVCKLTIEQIDRISEPWLYRLTDHKTAHHGKVRAIPLGPKARTVLVAFLRGDHQPPEGFGINLADSTARLVAADAYQEAGRERDAHLLRGLERPVVMVAGCVVDPTAPLFSPKEAREERYRNLRANRKSRVQPSQKNRKAKNPKRAPGSKYNHRSYCHAVEKAAEKAGVPHWHPNQLRHTYGTEVRRVHGLEAAQVLLGHSRADVTQVYAEKNAALAATVAEKIG